MAKNEQASVNLTQFLSILECGAMYPSQRDAFVAFARAADKPYQPYRPAPKVDAGIWDSMVGPVEFTLIVMEASCPPEPFEVCDEGAI